MTAMLFLLGLVLLSSEISFSGIAYPASVFFTSFSIWCVYSWYRVTRNYMDLYLLMLLAVVVFNGGHLILQAFLPHEEVILRTSSPFSGDFEDPIMIGTIVFVIWGIAFMHLGALWVGVRKKTKTFSSDDPASGESVADAGDSDARSTLQVGLFIVAVAFLPALLWELDAIRMALEGGGWRAFLHLDRKYGAAMRIMQSFLVPGALFLLAGGKGCRKALLISSILLIMYAGSNFFYGNRSAGFSVLLMLIWVWHARIKKIPKHAFVLMGIFMFFIALPSVRFIRQSDIYQDLSGEAIGSVLGTMSNPLRLALSETGNSMGSITHTLRLVPDLYPHGYGATYLLGASTVFPNFFWDRHPGSDLLGGQWFLEEVAPGAVKGHRRGTGYSLIAEAYYNFGAAGVPIVLLFWGIFIAKLTLWALGRDEPANLAMAASFGSFILLVSRGFIASIFRPFVWYSLFPYLLAIGWRNRHLSSEGMAKRGKTPEEKG